MNSSHRLAIYLPNLDGGGTERVMITLARAFAARGHATDLVLAKADGALLLEARAIAGVRVVDLGVRQVNTSILALSQYIPALTRYLRHERPLAMLSAMNHANVIALAARRLAGVQTRLIVSERGHLSAALQRTISAIGARCGPIMPQIMRLTYPWADHVVAVSNGVADDLSAMIRLPRDRISVIYNPSALMDQDLEIENTFDHPWFGPNEPPVLIGVGRLSVEKDFDVLIRAFAELRKTTLARLVILGEGSQRLHLVALVDSLGLREDVELMGFQSHPADYVRRAALFVLSSRHEGLPNALIEAMACGTPVVSTDCTSGPAEILENGKWGRLVPVGDVKALADAMQATLEETKHPDVKNRARDFGVEQAVDCYLQLLVGDRGG